MSSFQKADDSRRTQRGRRDAGVKERDKSSDNLGKTLMYRDARTRGEQDEQNAIHMLEQAVVNLVKGRIHVQLVSALRIAQKH